MRPDLRPLLTLLILIALSPVVSCQRHEAVPPTVEARKFRIGIVYDVGGRGDLSFNDMAYAGLSRTRREFGDRIETRDLELAASGENREDMLRQLAGEQFDLILGIGGQFTASITQVAKDFRHVRFAIIDGIIVDQPNVVSLVFREHEGSFLVGAAAAMKSKTGIIGFVGSMKDPRSEKFAIGYIAGAKHVRPDIWVISEHVRITDDPSRDLATSKELALALYDRGADIIYHALGPAGAGVLEAAVVRNKLVIGTDTDQSLTVKPDQRPHVLTSMMKRVDVAVYEIVAGTLNGDDKPGVREFGLAEGGLDYAVNDYNRKMMADVIPRLDALKNDIAAGKITPPSEMEQLDEFLKTQGK